MDKCKVAVITGGAHGIGKAIGDYSAMMVLPCSAPM